MSWFLYVLRCDDQTLYTGITNDVLRRLATHQAGRGARYTRMHLPVALEAAWIYPDRPAAMRAEVAFKRLKRERKEKFLAERSPFQEAPYAVEVFDRRDNDQPR